MAKDEGGPTQAAEFRQLLSLMVAGWLTTARSQYEIGTFRGQAVNGKRTLQYTRSHAVWAAAEASAETTALSCGALGGR